jgi:hypothetical protein
MIERISSALLLSCIVPMLVMGSEQTRSPCRHDPVVLQVPQQEAWLTKDQAAHLLTSVEMLVRQMQELSRQNKAPRPDAPGSCDSSFPGCGLCDLSGILESLCAIQLQLDCICERTASLQDVVGACSDLSTVLPSQTDKSDIDALCISVVSLLKTVLLELRGVFTNIS